MAYTTWGPVRDCCGHEHDTMDEAEACIAADARGCRAQGGYSDRQVREVEGYWRNYDVTRGPGRLVCDHP
ncbi:MAG: hypothetical protein DIU60_022110 [Actinomycetes bacterium]